MNIQYYYEYFIIKDYREDMIVSISGTGVLGVQADWGLCNSCEKRAPLSQV